MGKIRARNNAILLVGDFIAFGLSLWAALAVRYFSFPSFNLFSENFFPFIGVFVIWFGVFYIADLYGRQNVAFKRKLFSIVVRAQAVNAAVAIILFYFIPSFGIAPKTILFFTVLFSIIFVTAWRLKLSYYLSRGKGDLAVMYASGDDYDGLRKEIEQNEKYGITLRDISPEDICKTETGLVILDMDNEKTKAHLKKFYPCLLSGVRFASAENMYEEIFDRIPILSVKENWVLENVSTRAHFLYDTAKRLMDVIASIFIFAISLIFYPLVWVAIKLDDGGPIFFTQSRMGKGEKMIRIIKFRSWGADGITRVGKFLRRTRIDELPQIINVLKGDLSLVGPRPEIPELAVEYKKEIPFYEVRHIIKPGLSGWAQIYHENPPHHIPSVAETRDKLSYDLYYVKNRSFALDIKIALKTLKVLLSLEGR